MLIGRMNSANRSTGAGISVERAVAQFWILHIKATKITKRQSRNRNETSCRRVDVST